jgi:chemotaxis protein methyltransferase CheR
MADTDLLPPAELLSDADFLRLSAYIHASTGIKMPLSKKTFLEGRLRRRLRGRGFASFDEYCNYLFAQGGLGEEETAIIDAVTTNKTDFFREPHHFDFLTRTALPELVERGIGTRSPLRIWSAGCSTGAEPYTLAMVCQEFAQVVPQFKAEILATDISLAVLQDAARAVYPHAQIDPVPMELRKRYLLRTRDASKDDVRIAPELRQMVKYGVVNLMDGKYPIPHPMDIIFCRNVLIYFDKATQRAVLARLCRTLKAGGYLLLGHSESINGMSLPLRSVAATVFVHEGQP